MTTITVPSEQDPAETWEAFAREARLSDTPAGNKALRESLELSNLDPAIREIIERYRAMIVVTEPRTREKVLIPRERVQEMQTARERAEEGVPARDLTSEYYHRRGASAHGKPVSRPFSFGTLGSQAKRGRPPKDPDASKIIKGSVPLDSEPRSRAERDPDVEGLKAAILNGSLLSGDSGF